MKVKTEEPNHKPNSVKPSTFEFSKPLEYKNITEETVQTKKIQIDACVCQRMSRKGYTIGTINLDFKTAVKNLIRHKYILKAAPSSAIPNSMRVYSSIPNLRSPSFNSLIDNEERSSSDSNLRAVMVTRSCSSTSSIEIPIPEEEPDNKEDLSVVRINKNIEKREALVSFSEDNFDPLPDVIVETREKENKNVRLTIKTSEDSLPEVIVTKAEVHVPLSNY